MAITADFEAYLADEWYGHPIKNEAKDKCREAVRFILDRNIVWDGALTRKTVGKKPGYIIFSEWSDKKLYKHDSLSQEGIAFIQSKIRPMEMSDE